MFNDLLPVVQTINACLSDYILVFLLMGVGLFYSIRTRFVQIRCFGEGLRRVFGNFSINGKAKEGQMSSFQALATAIAAQVGTGNIVGACGAILTGGPGAIFWMWVIAVVGGGGKTSLIYRLADELLDRGKKVIITTTTHMAGESELPFARGGDAVEVKEMLDREGYVIAAEYEEETGKYASLKEGKLEELKELCDVMLIEADGAKHHPVKVPAEWEPVIPACADIVISVIGLDCLGQPIRQSAYRMERTSKFLKKSLEEPITEEDIVKIATSICGLFKDVEERIYRVYLNKSDVLSEKTPAEYIVEELEKKHTVAAYGSLWEE